MYPNRPISGEGKGSGMYSCRMTELESGDADALHRITALSLILVAGCVGHSIDFGHDFSRCVPLQHIVVQQKET